MVPTTDRQAISVARHHDQTPCDRCGHARSSVGGWGGFTCTAPMYWSDGSGVYSECGCTSFVPCHASSEPHDGHREQAHHELTER